MREREDELTFGFSPAHAFRATLRHIGARATQPDFIVSTGDLVHSGTAAEYQSARAMLGLREFSPAPGPQRATVEGLNGVPMYFLPGNHDPREVFFRSMFPQGGAPGAAASAAMTPAPTAATADRAAPTPAMNVVFTYQGMRFICIDWGGENKPVATPAMLDFLAHSLEDRSPAILLMHHALVPIGIARLDSFLPDDLSRFEAIVRGSSVRAMFCGHFHATYDTLIAGIPVYGLRSTTFSFAAEGDRTLLVLRPPHYRVVSVSDNAVTSDIVEVAL